MTREQAIYEILEIIRGHQLSDDLDIDPREVEFNLDNARATILTQYLNKPGRLIPPVVIQDLGCVALETADPAECCEVDTGCDVLRTNILPSFLNLNGKPLNPNFDYQIVDSNYVQLSARFNIAETDRIVVTSISDLNSKDTVAYRQFKDMANRVQFKRLSNAHSTALTKELKATDKTIEVLDASIFGNVELS